MPERYTKRDARNAFEHLAETMGVRVADPAWPISDPRREGAWILDHNGVYGGYVIAAYVPDSPPRPGDDRPQAYTAQTHPLTDYRQSARDFSQMCHFAARAVAASRHRTKRERGLARKS
jgi:hypothetical protein